MNRIVVFLLLFISSWNLVSCTTFNLQKLHEKFQRAALEDVPINRSYIYSKNLENSVTGNVDDDVPTTSDLANHPFKDYLTFWVYDSFYDEYNKFLFSLSGRSDLVKDSFWTPFGSSSDIRFSRVTLTSSEQEYVDQHPDEFLELLDEAMLKYHRFWPYLRLTKFDCAELDLPKTKFLRLVENDPRYSKRVPRDSFQSRKRNIFRISKFANWRFKNSS